MKKKNIVPITEYSTYHVNIMPLLRERGVSKNSLCRRTGIAYNALQRYCKSEIKRVDLDVISRICAALECELSDIIVIKKDSPDKK